MKIGELIKLLEQQDPDDRIQVKVFTDKSEIGQVNYTSSKFMKIAGLTDDTNVGVWNLIVYDFDENETIWEPTIDWDYNRYNNKYTL